jgi:hypothetical protein
VLLTSWGDVGGYGLYGMVRGRKAENKSQQH